MSGSRPRSPVRWAWTCGWGCRRRRRRRAGRRPGRTGRGPQAGPRPGTAGAPEALGHRGLRRPGLSHPPGVRRDHPVPRPERPGVPGIRPPATNGIATADALARFYAALIGEVDGIRLFDPATVAAARAEESAGPDRVLVVNTRFGLGYMLHGSASPLLGPGSFGHPGRGGALGFADPETGVALGYVTNGFRKTVHGGSACAGAGRGSTRRAGAGAHVDRVGTSARTPRRSRRAPWSATASRARSKHGPRRSPHPPSAGSGRCGDGWRALRAYLGAVGQAHHRSRPGVLIVLLELQLDMPSHSAVQHDDHLRKTCFQGAPRRPRMHDCRDVDGHLVRMRPESISHDSPSTN
ncbi:hypothetical protein SALBM311S_04171 [Streptomyces alboniger]